METGIAPGGFDRGPVWLFQQASDEAVEKSNLEKSKESSKILMYGEI